MSTVGRMGPTREATTVWMRSRGAPAAARARYRRVKASFDIQEHFIVQPIGSPATAPHRHPCPRSFPPHTVVGMAAASVAMGTAAEPLGAKGPEDLRFGDAIRRQAGVRV